MYCANEIKSEREKEIFNYSIVMFGQNLQKEFRRLFCHASYFAEQVNAGEVKAMRNKRLRRRISNK